MFKRGRKFMTDAIKLNNMIANNNYYQIHYRITDVPSDNLSALDLPVLRYQNTHCR